MADQLTAQLKNVGESILQWADPNTSFRGYTEGWPLTDFPTAFYIAAAYLAFVLLGSLVMKVGGLPAMDPYPIKFIYNVSQIMLCAYMTIEAGLLAYRNNYTLLPCNDYSQKAPPVANVLWLFYVSKVWDFWDTIFIVIGKKWRQLSFLHVYHHTTIFLFYWLNSHVNYDGDIYLTIVLNGFIHTVMYTYYCTLFVVRCFALLVCGCRVHAHAFCPTSLSHFSARYSHLHAHKDPGNGQESSHMVEE